MFRQTKIFNIVTSGQTVSRVNEFTTDTGYASIFCIGSFRRTV